MTDEPTNADGRATLPAGTILGVFLRLGLTSFGDPVAHLDYFREEFVARRKWLDERAYADLVALCQFLPGPASSQVGIGVGLSKGGLIGAVAAWIGFTLPSALAMALFGLGVVAMGDSLDGGWLHGLKVVAVAVVATLVVLISPTPIAQVDVIVAGGLAGLLLASDSSDGEHVDLGAGVSRAWALAALAVFFALLVGLPLAAQLVPDQSLALVDSFYRSGSLVFGGGHVVLPLLQSEVMPPGWVGNDAFMAGYGAAQAVPGPLFTFAAYLVVR